MEHPLPVKAILLLMRLCMLQKLIKENGEFGVFSAELIAEGTLVFSSADWVNDEVSGWQLLTLEEVEKLPEYEKEMYLRYSYDKDFNLMIGTFLWENATHLSNFINHSCEPNTRYDLNDNIVAARDILPGEEITVDYGTFVVNVDQNFLCRCGSASCRGQVKKDDWKHLVERYQFFFPRFLHPEIEKLPARQNIRHTD